MRNHYLLLYEFPDPSLYERLQFSEAFCGKVIVAVTSKLEAIQSPQLLALAVGHERFGNFVEGCSKDGGAALCVGVEVAKIVFHRKWEKCHAIVKDRRESTGGVAPVVDKQSKIAKVTAVYDS